MKKILIAFAILSIFVFVSVASAQGPGMMWGGQQGWQYCPYCGQPLGQGGYGMGPGMMRGYGGYGMGPGMMWGGGYYGQSEQCQKFLDDTSGLRKDLNDKRYDYYEAIRNPKSTSETIAKLEKEIRNLQEKIYSKAPQGCW